MEGCRRIRNASSKGYTTMKESRRDFYRRMIAEQQQWITEHGGTEFGYIQRYGSKDDPEHYGDGGELIYRADFNALRSFEQALKVLDGK